ncbi:hypothetical protein [Streptomyces sp. KL116D]|uniref:hypothetical protein n=1 Tax=Streptomyces sp. KL116D TaxID=3045152 RepID=UPI0035581262
MTGRSWGRPAAGREPAAAAILAWLSDPAAPRLCVVTGSEGCGKSTLLAWLIGHGTRPGTPAERRVHGFVPMAGLTATSAAWMLAEQLEVPARTPGELVDLLSADVRRTVVVLPDVHAAADAEGVAELALALQDVAHVRVLVEVRSASAAAEALASVASARMDLDEPRWTDPERYARWAAEERTAGERTAGERTAGDRAPASPPVAIDLDDPAAVCAAAPWRVSTSYEQSSDAHGGLRAAWLRAGASLTRDQSPAERAVVLLAALGDDADPRLSQALSDLSAGAPWRVLWRRVRGDITPPWPGPVRALAGGRGPLAGQLVVTDHRGTVRLLREEDAAAIGRLPAEVPEAKGVAVQGDGSVAAIDGNGQLVTQYPANTAGSSGLLALLDDGPSSLEKLLEEAVAYAKSVTVTALASTESAIVMGDRAGTVHVVTGDADRSRTAALHQGPVTALASVRLPVSDDGTTVPLLYSGGADGAVRVWAPGADPMATPFLSRPHPVTALAVGGPDGGQVLTAAWSDGLVEQHEVGGGTVRGFRPGGHVHALALTSAGHLVVGTDESLICLSPA